MKRSAPRGKSAAPEPHELPAERILAMQRSAELYPADAAQAKKLYRRLSMKWHPDRAGREDVFKRLKELYEKLPQVRKAQVATFDGADGAAFNIHYRLRRPFELGELFITDHLAVYFIAEAHTKLVDKGLELARALPFADDKMRAEHQRYLPQIARSRTVDGGRLIAIKRDPELICLHDVLERGPLPPRHAAWILSSLYAFRAYLGGYAQICHQDICPETVFIHPAKHSVAVLGGWWYARRVGQKLEALPARTVENAALDSRKKASAQTDADLIRFTGREAIGAAALTKVPAALRRWLLTPGASDPVEEYAAWMDTLQQSFGARRFVKLDLQASDYY
jgi:hypothetical protein